MLGGKYTQEDAAFGISSAEKRGRESGPRFWRCTLGTGRPSKVTCTCLVRYLIDVKIECIQSISSCSKLGMFW